MNKVVLIVTGVVIVVVSGVTIYIFSNKNNNSVTAKNTNNGQSQDVKTGSDVIVAVDACDVLTENIAKQVLGDTAKNGEIPGGTSTKDVTVSSCVYTARIDPNGKISISNTKGVSVLVRAAKTNTGAGTNKAQFSSAKPAGVQDVSGIGDAAYFDPQFGQLNILKGGNWYIVTNYAGSTNGTVESNKLLANLLSLK
jgi:hypothetical protein